MTKVALKVSSGLWFVLLGAMKLEGTWEGVLSFQKVVGFCSQGEKWGLSPWHLLMCQFKMKA